MQKPIGGGARIGVFRNQKHVEKQAAADKQEFKLFKREGGYSPSTSLPFCNMFN
jgi:hypothetical protein